MSNYVISGDKTGKTYGVYEVKNGEVLPPVEREPIIKGIATLEEASKIVANLKMKKK